MPWSCVCTGFCVGRHFCRTTTQECKCWIMFNFVRNCHFSSDCTISYLQQWDLVAPVSALSYFIFNFGHSDNYIVLFPYDFNRHFPNELCFLHVLVISLVKCMFICSFCNRIVLRLSSSYFGYMFFVGRDLQTFSMCFDFSSS